jgi:hypothetical protein
MRFILLLALALVISGCEPEIVDTGSPLYFESDLIEDDALVGNWGEGLIIESLGNNTYQIKFPKDDVLEFRVLKLGDHFFIDLKNPERDLHGIGRIAILGDKLCLSGFRNDWLKELCRNSPHQVPHRIDRKTTQIGQETHTYERLILTGDTRFLQAFVLKHINNPAAFSKNDEWVTKVGTIGVQASGLASKKYRTFNYWYEVRRIMKIASVPKTVDKNYATALEETANSWAELPTVGVDLIAVECTQNLVRTFKQFAALIREGGDNGKMAEAFLRGMAGDPFGVANEQLQKRNAMGKQFTDCFAQCENARVLLTDRYEMEFPELK